MANRYYPCRWNVHREFNIFNQRKCGHTIRRGGIHNYGDGSWGNYTYSFLYDNMNRLTNANSTIAANTENYVYNGDGRFESKNRTGNITYNYTNADNKIESVTVNGSNYSFAYDAKGNVTNDGLNNALPGNYSFRNLPTTMNNFSYTYNDNSERIKKTEVDSARTDYYLRDYLGRELVVYNYETNDPKEVNIFGNGLIGKIELTDSAVDRYYYLKDHLGSVRSVVDNNGSVVSAQDYYPYGETIRQFNNTRYMLTEKERDTESGNDYFGARYYNSKLGVWLQVDPLSEKYPGVSPYSYAFGNPMRFVDPKGMEPQENEEEKKKREAEEQKKKDALFNHLANGGEGFPSERDYSYAFGVGGFVIGRSDKILSESFNAIKQLVIEGTDNISALTKIGALKTATEFLGTAGLVISTAIDAEAFKSGSLSTSQFLVNLSIGAISYLAPGSGFGLFLFDKVGGIERMFQSHAEHVRRNIKLGIPVPSLGTGW